MYTDARLIFAKKTDAAAAVSTAVPLVQGDFSGLEGADGATDGAAPYDGLFLYVAAGEAIAAADVFTVKLQHSDTQDGAFTDLMAYPAVSKAKTPGDAIVSAPVPHGAKNWLRLAFSVASQKTLKKVDAFLTNAVDKHYPGVWDGSAD